MGGKSSSSSATESNTTTSTATSTGIVGDVLQGQNITVNQDLPDQAVDVFKQLVAIVGQSIDLVGDAGNALVEGNKNALEATQGFAEKVVQPDLSAISGYQKQVYYAIAAVTIVAAIMFWRK